MPGREQDEPSCTTIAAQRSFVSQPPFAAISVLSRGGRCSDRNRSFQRNFAKLIDLTSRVPASFGASMHRVKSMATLPSDG